MINKICLFAAVFILGVGFLMTGCANRQGEDRVLAGVNDYRMTIEDFNYESGEILRIGRMVGESPITKQEMLDMLITKEILIQQAVEEGLNKDKSFTKAIEFYWEQMLLKSLLAKKSGEIAKKTVVYEDDITRYYDNMKNKIKATVIVFSDEKSARKALRCDESAFEQWKNDPEKYSIEAIISSRWYALGEDETPAESAVFDVNAGKSRDVAKLNEKWVLVIIEDREPREVGALDDIRDEITENIRSAKEKEAMDNWIGLLRSKSKIKINHKIFDTLN